MEVDQSDTGNIEEPNSHQIQILKSKFGFENFKDEQWQAIKCLMYNKRDCFFLANSIFPSEIVYQFIAICSESNGITVVFSPRSASINQQIEELKIKEINSSLLLTRTKKDMTDDEHEKIIFVNLDGHMKQIKKYLSILSEIRKNIGLIVIDECHSISKLSCRFRPNLLTSLNHLKESFPLVPFLCLSSNATDIVRNDVVKSLKLVDPLIVKTCLDHPNVEIKFKTRSKDLIGYDEIKMLIGCLEKNCALVVVPNQKEADSCADYFRQHFDIDAESYHAGLSKPERKSIAERFRNNQNIQLMFATDNFPELIRKDIRVSIHLKVPKSIDKFYDIFNDTGRDGQHSQCIILYEDRDLNILPLYQSKDAQLNKQEDKMWKKMRDFVLKTKCRRMSMLQYFDKNAEQLPNREKCCDVCQIVIFSTVPMNLLFHGLNIDGFLDISKDSRDLIDVMLPRKHQNIMQIVKFLRGIDFETAYRFPLKFFGKGSKKSKEYWMAIYKTLIYRGMINSSHVLREGIQFWYRTSQILLVDPKIHNLLKYLQRTDKVFIVENGSYRCVDETIEEKSSENCYQISATNSKAEKRKHAADDDVDEDLFAFSMQSKRKKNETRFDRCDETSTDTAKNAEKFIKTEESDDEYVDNMRLGKSVGIEKTKEYFSISGIDSEFYDTEDDE